VTIRCKPHAREGSRCKDWTGTSTFGRIMQHSFWEGQTSEQLIDSLGNPLSVDQKIFKSNKREVWKYNRKGSNRYGLRITLDGDTVVG